MALFIMDLANRICYSWRSQWKAGGTILQRENLKDYFWVLTIVKAQIIKTSRKVRQMFSLNFSMKSWENILRFCHQRTKLTWEQGIFFVWEFFRGYRIFHERKLQRTPWAKEKLKIKVYRFSRILTSRWFCNDWKSLELT